MRPLLEYYGRPARAEAFLADSGGLAEEVRRELNLVLYQAGADPHIDDPFGGWLAADQLYRRDRAVFDGLRRLSIPVAWNLAGGCRRDAAGSIRPVLDIHDNTMVAFFQEAYGHASIPDAATRKEAA